VAQDRRTFALALVTPEGPAFEGEVEMLIVPGAAGEIGILARHAPLVATLKAGGTRVHIRRDEEVRDFATGPGFFKVEQDRALQLVDDAVDAREIDPERARRQLEEAKAELERLDRGEDTGADRWQLEQRVAHAENQLEVYSGGGTARIRPVAPASG
jgi:F-type H+-transporting ATPase subunit epsilon